MYCITKADKLGSGDFKWPNKNSIPHFFFVSTPSFSLSLSFNPKRYLHSNRLLQPVVSMATAKGLEGGRE